MIGIWLLVCWIGVGGWTCLGMMEVSFVTPKVAKEMGIDVSARASGPKHVWVTLRFEKKGRLEHYGPERYSRVEMRIGDGEQPLVVAGLKERSTKEGEVQVSLMVARQHLDSTALMVVVGSGLIPGGGYEVKLKDFVDLEAVDAARRAQAEERKRQKAGSKGGGAPAASPAVPAAAVPTAADVEDGR